MAGENPIKRRLQAIKAHWVRIDLQKERERALRHSIEVLDHLLYSPARPDSAPLLRRIVLARAAVHVKQNSLTDRF